MNPARSTTYAALGGAATIILTWVAREFAAIEVPAEVGQAITLIVSTLLVHFTDDDDRSLPPRDFAD